MTPRLALMESRIRKELVQLGRLEDELRLMAKVKDAKLNVFRLRACASILHDFYSGIEKVFVSIAREIDGVVPKSDGWHREILEQMALEIPSKRPAVIDRELARELERYLSFRHRFRHLYGYELEWSRLEPLIEGLGDTLQLFDNALDRFLTVVSDIVDE
ncbi:MAG: hypothetical protein C4575_13125 [Desulforudis sp.]|jgi:hypothetical protein|nr:MAG: hypothetical protein C4575_13125 [Desulforudis sp.]